MVTCVHAVCVRFFGWRNVSWCPNWISGLWSGAVAPHCITCHFQEELDNPPPPSLPVSWWGLISDHPSACPWPDQTSPAPFQLLMGWLLQALPHWAASTGPCLRSLHSSGTRDHTCKEHPDVAPPVVSQNGHVLALDRGLCPAFSVN